MEPVCISVTQAMQTLGLGRTKLYELINTKKLRIVRVGRRTLISTESIRDLVSPASRTTAA
jgi:excisionase family DNA binding protein